MKFFSVLTASIVVLSLFGDHVKAGTICDCKSFDVVFVFDESNNVSSTELEHEKNFVKSIINDGFNWGTGYQQSRAAMVRYQNNAYVMWDFVSSTHTAAMYVQSIDTITHLGGQEDCSPGGLNSASCRLSDIEEGLLKAAELLMTQGRPCSRKVVILLTDGAHNQGDPPPEHAAVVIRSHLLAEIIAIGSGDASLESLSGSPSQAFVTQFSQLESHKYQVVSLLTADQSSTDCLKFAPNEPTTGNPGGTMDSGIDRGGHGIIPPTPISGLGNPQNCLLYCRQFRLVDATNCKAYAYIGSGHQHLGDTCWIKSQPAAQSPPLFPSITPYIFSGIITNPTACDISIDWIQQAGIYGNQWSCVPPLGTPLGTSLCTMQYRDTLSFEAGGSIDQGPRGKRELGACDTGSGSGEINFHTPSGVQKLEHATGRVTLRCMEGGAVRADYGSTTFYSVSAISCTNP